MPAFALPRRGKTRRRARWKHRLMRRVVQPRCGLFAAPSPSPSIPSLRMLRKAVHGFRLAQILALREPQTAEYTEKCRFPRVQRFRRFSSSSLLDDFHGTLIVPVVIGETVALDEDLGLAPRAPPSLDQSKTRIALRRGGV